MTGAKRRRGVPCTIPSTLAETRRIASVSTEHGPAVLTETERVLRQNWLEGTRRGTDSDPEKPVAYAYTRPSPTRYPWQWFWDSCFSAIVWRRFDADRSRAELESLLAAQRPNGFIGHTIFWAERVSLQRYPFYNVLSRSAFQTESIQPPLLAWAWKIAVGDPAAEPRIEAHADWLTANRDIDGDGLLWIVQPDEAGIDASPKFDPVWGRRAQGRVAFPLLVGRNRHLDFDAKRILGAGGPLVCETLVNVLWCLSLKALGRDSITPAIVDRLWNEERGCFDDAVLPAQHDPGAAPLTWAALAPLALPDLPEEMGRRMIEEHVLDEGEFLTPVAPPSVAISEPSYEPMEHGFLRRYWRGPTWVNSAWMVWLGLVRLGYHEEAARMVDGLAGAVAREGLREYYEPTTGEGEGAVDFAWSALIAEMVDPDPKAASSYLD